MGFLVFAASAILVAVLLPVHADVDQQDDFYYETCFAALHTADADHNLQLTRTEFGDFVSIISGGAASFTGNLLPSLSDPFLSRAEGGSLEESLPLPRNDDMNNDADVAFIAEFCQDIYHGLFEFFALDTDSDDCVSALQVADLPPTQNGRLDEIEYLPFVMALTGISLSTSVQVFADLPVPLQEAFHDLAVDGEIRGPRGMPYLNEFCQRVAIAVAVAFPPPTTVAPATALPSPAPTAAPATTRTVTPTSEPEPLTPAAFSSCKTSLIISDGNRNNWLDQDEYVALLNRLLISSGNGDLQLSSAIAYEDLDPNWTENFEALLNSGEDALNLRGARPGVTPTDEQLAYLRRICTRTYSTIHSYRIWQLLGGDSNNNNDNTTATGVSEEFYADCQQSMRLADLTRDDRLGEEEYVIFINRLLPDDVDDSVTTVATAYADLDPLLQEGYTAVAVTSSRGVDIYGSKPGQSPTDRERVHLQEVCAAAQAAIAEYVEYGPSTVPPDDSGSTTETPSLPPVDDGLSDADYRLCRTAMLIADGNRDDNLGEEEYVRLLNRLTFSKFSGYSFDDLHPLFRFTFDEVASPAGNVIDVSGSKATMGGTNSPTDAQEAHLREICLAVHTAIVDFEEATDAPTNAPTVAATDVRPPPDISEDDYEQCKEELLAADVNKDLLLEPEDYVSFLNVLADTSFQSFDYLPADFQDNYNAAKIGAVGFVDIFWASTSQENDTLRLLCAQTFATIQEYKDESLDRPDCAPQLYAADIDMDGSLTTLEYLGLVNYLADLNTTVTDLDNLPYLLRETFAWIKLGQETVDVTGAATDETVSAGDLLRLGWICDRLATTLEAIHDEDGAATTLSEHCAASTTAVNDDNDGFLNETEYISLINVFTGVEWEGLDIDTIDAGYRLIFDEAKEDDNGFVGIGSGDIEAEVCERLEDVTQQTRINEAFYQLCRLALVEADLDADNHLDQTEYGPFLYNMGMAYGLTDEYPEGLLFEDLDIALQRNFDILKEDSDAIVIHEDVETLRWICASTEEVIDLVGSQFNEKATFTTVYNSFLISNKIGLEAVDLEFGDEREGLQRAYVAFVEAQIASTQPSTNLRSRRHLSVDGIVPSSTSVYRIDDSDCPNGLSSSETCQVAFGLFDLRLSNEDDPDSVSGSISYLTQNAIDNNFLQESLSVADPDSPLTVVSSSKPLQPIGSDNLDDDDDNNTSKDEGWGPTIGFAALASTILFGAGLVCYFCHKRLKNNSPPKLTQEAHDENHDEFRNETYDTTLGQFPVGDDDSISDQSNNDSNNEDNLRNEQFGTVLPEDRTPDESFTSFGNHNDEEFRNEPHDVPLHQCSVDETYGSFDEFQDDGEDELLPESLHDSAPNKQATEEPAAGSQDVLIDGSYETDEPLGYATTNTLPAAPRNKSQQREDFIAEQQPTIEPEYYSTNSEFIVDSYEVTPIVSAADTSLAAFGNDSKQKEDFIAEKQLTVEPESKDPRTEIGSVDNSTPSYVPAGISIQVFVADEFKKDDESVQNDESLSNEEEITEEQVDVKKKKSMLNKEEEEIEGVVYEEETVYDEDVSEEEVLSESEDENDENDEASESSSDASDASSEDEADTIAGSIESIDSTELRASIEKYGPVITELVQEIMPDEIGNVNTMIEQFLGREEELVESLQVSTSHRAQKKNTILYYWRITILNHLPTSSDSLQNMADGDDPDDESEEESETKDAGSDGESEESGSTEAREEESTRNKEEEESEEYSESEDEDTDIDSTEEASESETASEESEEEDSYSVDNSEESNDSEDDSDSD